MSRYLVASVEGFLLGILIGILLGATLGSSHVYSPRPAWTEGDEGVQPWDERTVTLAAPYRAEWRVH